MPTFTTHFGFYKPAEGDGQGNAQQWAEGMNGNLDEIDALLKTHGDTLASQAADIAANATALAGKMTNPMTTAGDMIIGGAAGAATRVAAGTNGHIWTMVGGVPTWAAPGSASGYAAWDPDAPPASPSSSDDEFGGSGLDAAWTGINLASATAWDVNSTVPGCLYVKTPTLSTTLVAVVRSIPAGDFTIVTKIAYASNASSPNGGCGLILSTTAAAGSGSQVLINAGTAGSSGSYAQAVRWTNFNALSSLIGASANRDINYLRVRRVGTDYYFGWSEDGKTWAEIAGTLPFTPLYFGLAVYTNTGVLSSSFEHFRYSSSGTATFGRSVTRAFA